MNASTDQHPFTIISGGQTGVDRAALDAAMAFGLPVDGWCPQGRLAEDGVIDATYPLKETPLAEYAQRTAWNVRDSEGTLVLLGQHPSPGTSLTIAEAHARSKALLVLHLVPLPEDEAVQEWMAAHNIRTLNVAGPRESESPGIYDAARDFLEKVFANIRRSLMKDDALR